MNTAIIYSSETGFTEKYAKWLKESLKDGAELFTLRDAKRKTVETWKKFDAVVYGGWCCAGNVNGFLWFRKNILQWASEGKKLAVWATGASPIGTPDIELLMKNLLNEEEHKIVKTFYCPGGLLYEKMSLKNRMFMKMFEKMLATSAKKNKSLEPMVEMVSHSYDISDRKYIDPLLSYLH